MLVLILQQNTIVVGIDNWSKQDSRKDSYSKHDKIQSGSFADVARF